MKKILGVGCALIGVVGLLQGFRAIHLPIMSTHTARWLVSGAVALIVGVVILLVGNKKKGQA
jgi:uncharacterized membrane protein HdeD (DUF308 family)